MAIHIQLRFFIQKLNLNPLPYLVLALAAAMIMAFIGFFVGYQLSNEVGILVVFYGGTQALLAYLFMKSKDDVIKILWSLIFSFWSYLLAKYLMFEHLWDWFLSSYIDKNGNPLELFYFYLTAMNMESIQMFLKAGALSWKFWDFIWVLTLVLMSLSHQILPFENAPKTKSSHHRKIFSKRRFD